jgi:CHAT domain-containing protein
MKKSDFTHVDWETEIDSEEPHLKEYLEYRVSDATINWTIIENTMQISESDDINKKSNTIRTLQYFLGKFILHHSNFYKRKVFEKDSDYNPLEKYQSILKSLPQSKVSVDTLHQLELALTESNAKRRLEESKTHGTTEELIKEFEKNGLNVTYSSSNKKRSDRDVFEYIYEGLTFRVFSMRKKLELRKKEIVQDVQEINTTIKRYDYLIKPIAEILKNNGVENLWIMCGGGSQRQIFFGNENGYIGILYLDMKQSKSNSNKYRIVTQGKGKDTEKNLHYFNGVQSVMGIKVRKF